MRHNLRVSLTARLLVALILPTAALALVLGVGGALFITRIVEGVNDRPLDASVRSIADTLALEDGEVTLDLPPSAFGMLENEERDNVYYSAYVGNDLLTGYPDLPRIDMGGGRNDETRFAYSTYRDSPIRVAAIVRRVPRVEAPIVVQVAETMDARKSLSRQMLGGLFALEALLIGLLVLLLPLAVRWGLQPLAEVRRGIDSRSATDFTPLTLQQVPTELRGFVTAFNGLLFRLRDAVEGLRRFTADASHQMRTPLSILRAHLQVLKREGTQTPVGQASLVDIDIATARLQRLLTQLLALARAEGNRESYARLVGLVDLSMIARSVAEDYVPAALRNGIDIQFESAGQTTAPTVAELARELLSNLVDNAIRYNHKGGTVWLRVVSRDGMVSAVVEDDGPGIPAQMQADVFQRFLRLDRDRTVEGSGLGLAIVKVLADALAAGIRIASRPAGGLRIDVDFPVAADRPRAAGKSAS
ncbi:MAG: sensor histidine kinase [Steroidobacteraceae bacterium]